MQHIACVNFGLDAVACTICRKVGVFPMVEENKGMCVYGIALHVLGMIQGRMMSWRFSHPGVEDGGSWTMLAQKCMIL
jgi:hypothetical protein